MKKVYALATCLLMGTIASASSQEIQSHVASQPQQQTGANGKKSDASGGLSMGKHDSHAPIDINSDAFVGDYNTKIGTYTGNVIAIQTDYKLRADKMDVDIVDGKVNKIFAHGNVVFATTSGTGTGDDGEYDLNDPPTVTLTGNKVVLVKEKNVMRGTKLVVDVNSGIAHMSQSGGRVSSRFYPKQKQDGDETKPSEGGSTAHPN